MPLRALGRSVLGLELDERADAVAEPLRVALTYIADRALRPIRAPRWLHTPTRRRARAAGATMKRLANEILQACRSDPSRDAPLVHALIAATDPSTGRALSDVDICNELIVFMLGGHDTTATTLACALWALGRHRDLQDRVAAEVVHIGDREFTPDDVPRLGYTVQVVHEAMRLCPPVAAVARMATRDIEVDGYRVEAGTMLAVGICAPHRDPALWDNPLAFDPDRFSPQKSKGRDRWQIIPFGADRDHASGTTSPCSKPPSRWPASFAVPKSFPWTTISRWPRRSPRSPQHRSGPAYTSGFDRGHDCDDRLGNATIRPRIGDHRSQ